MQKKSLDHDKRPWGEFQVIDSGDGFQVKRIIVLPGKRLSLQSHKFRKEHWVVSSGEAEVEINNNNFDPKYFSYLKTQIYSNLETSIPFAKRIVFLNSNIKFCILIGIYFSERR